MIKIDIITIFPAMFTGPFSESIVFRAQEKGLLSINIHDLRLWTHDQRHTVDDRPYGGGPGMVMMVEPIDKALRDLSGKNTHSILTSAKGNRFNQGKAKELSQKDHLIFIAGHYEGVDQRVADHLVNEEVSIGDYVLTGGELPIMVMVDAISRLIPGVVGDPQSLEQESHNSPGILEYPQYTRPEKYHDWAVPDILLSGNHAAINKWRVTQTSKNK